MKKTLTLVTLILIAFGANSQWSISSGPGTLNTFAMDFFGSKTGLSSGQTISGMKTAIVRSTNGGQSWTQVIDTDLGKTGNLFTVDCADATTAYAGGFNYSALLLYKSTDQGLTWDSVPVSAPMASSIAFTWMDFTDASNGYALLGNTDLAKTSDGGNNWQMIKKKDDGVEEFSCAYTKNSSTVYAATSDDAGNFYFYKSINGGGAWDSSKLTLLTDPNESPVDIYFIDANKGFIVCGFGVLLTTTNGGSSWTRMAINNSYEMYAIRFLNTTEGFITGERDRMWFTSDAGSNWKEVYVASADPFNFDLMRPYFFSKTEAACGSLTGSLPYLRFNNKIKTNASIVQVPSEIRTVYPNPAKDVLFIENHAVVTGNAGIYDVSGKLLRNIQTGISSVDISDLQPGLYILKSETSEGIVVARFVKE